MAQGAVGTAGPYLHLMPRQDDDVGLRSPAVDGALPLADGSAIRNPAGAGPMVVFLQSVAFGWLECCPTGPATGAHSKDRAPSITRTLHRLYLEPFRAALRSTVLLRAIKLGQG